MRDIAQIEKGYEEPTRNEMFFDSERAQGILIAASSGTDIVKVGAEVEKRLAQLKETRLPAGVDCHKVFYQPERVGASLGTFHHQPDRVCHHRSAHSDGGYGIQKWGHYRNQSGGHRLRFIYVSIYGRRNNAACITGRICPRNGYVGRQCHRHH